MEKNPGFQIGVNKNKRLKRQTNKNKKKKTPTKTVANYLFLWTKKICYTLCLFHAYIQKKQNNTLFVFVFSFCLSVRLFHQGFSILGQKDLLLFQWFISILFVDKVSSEIWKRKMKYKLLCNILIATPINTRMWGLTVPILSVLTRKRRKKKLMKRNSLLTFWVRTLKIMN